MAAEAVALEDGEDVPERLVADLPDGARGQRQPVALALEVAGLLELLRQLAELVEVALGLLAQEPADLLWIDPLEVPRVLDRAELALELVQLLQLLHETHRLT